jgi:DNA invertase Pin-like site-specific DNA recombinase
VADQVAALRAAGAVKVYSEKQSGAKSDRPQLAKAIRSLAPGDVFMVTRLDRLARSTRDLLNVLHEVGERDAAFKSLADTWADTTTPHGRLMVTILGGLAEFERSLIKARCDVGIARARAAGIRFGRKPKLSAFQRTEAMQRREAGESQRAIARTYSVDQATISRLQA